MSTFKTNSTSIKFPLYMYDEPEKKEMKAFIKDHDLRPLERNASRVVFAEGASYEVTVFGDTTTYRREKH